jgi:hypothetical protein
MNYMSKSNFKHTNFHAFIFLLIKILPLEFYKRFYLLMGWRKKIHLVTQNESFLLIDENDQ